MTVAELIAELQKMPPDLPVTRYVDDVVEYIELRETWRDESTPDQWTQHVALW